ncbi:MAG: hypothetical protein HYU25_14385 [Candidatus Rokubacteria bacterium]|nr:hypothetical protein [Candidatus Rokubacteria bacterium]
MPFKPPIKRGQKRRVVLEFRGPRKDAQLKRLSKAVKALAKKHKLTVVKRKRG